VALPYSTVHSSTTVHYCTLSRCVAYPGTRTYKPPLPPAAALAPDTARHAGLPSPRGGATSSPPGNPPHWPYWARAGHMSSPERPTQGTRSWLGPLPQVSLSRSSDPRLSPSDCSQSQPSLAPPPCSQGSRSPCSWAQAQGQNAHRSSPFYRALLCLTTPGAPSDYFPNSAPSQAPALLSPSYLSQRRSSPWHRPLPGCSRSLG